MFLGLIFAAVGWFVGGNPHRGWVSTTGRAVLSWRFGLQPSYLYLDTQGVEHPGYTWFSNLPRGNGTPVAVIFDPANPTRSRLDTFVQKGHLFIALGAVLVILGLLVTVLLAVGQANGWFG